MKGLHSRHKICKHITYVKISFVDLSAEYIELTSALKSKAAWQKYKYVKWI